MPDDRMVFFHLKDGSRVQSFAGHHTRLEGCYQVSGEVVGKGEFPKPFDGIILDDEIQRVAIRKFNPVGTLAGLLVATLPAAILVLVLGG